MPLRNKWNKAGHLHLSSCCCYGKCKGPAVPVLNYAPCHEDMRGSGGIILCISNLALDGIEGSASRPDHFIPQCPLHRGLLGPWGSVGCCGEEANLCSLAATQSLHQLGHTWNRSTHCTLNLIMLLFFRDQSCQLWALPFLNPPHFYHYSQHHWPWHVTVQSTVLDSHLSLILSQIFVQTFLLTDPNLHLYQRSTWSFLFFVFWGHLMMLSVSRLYTIKEKDAWYPGNRLWGSSHSLIVVFPWRDSAKPWKSSQDSFCPSQHFPNMSPNQVAWSH
jgi:hypothetical protein